MGIVRKQGIVSALVIYAGFGFGALNLLVLFPKFFSPEEIGLTRVLFAFSNIMLQLSLLGMVPTITKFNPFYKDYLPAHKNDLYARALLVATFGFICMSLFSWIFQADICDYFIERSPLLVVYYNLIYPFTFTLLIFTILETISQSNLKTILANTLKEVGVRVITSLILVVTIIGWIDFNLFIKLFSVLIYGIPSVILLIYLIKTKRLNFTLKKSRVSHHITNKMVMYAMFSYSGVLIFVMSQQADTILIASIVGLQSTTVYMVADYISTLLQVPARSLTGIISPLMSIAWKEKDMVQIKTLYQKTAINQLIAGLIIFGLIWSNIDLVLNFLGDDYVYAKTLIVVLAASRLLDLGFGPNNELLATSNYWKFNFYSLVVLMAIFLPTNYYFIKTYGPVGAAYSNLLSFSCFNITRWIFIYTKFKIQPFTIAFFKVIIPFAIAIGLGYLVPEFSVQIVSHIMKTTIFILLFSICIIALKPSEDIHELGKKFLNKIIRTTHN